MDTLYEVDWYKAYPAYPLNFKKSIYMYCYAVVSTESSFKQFKTSRIYWGSFKCRWYKEKQYLFFSWPGSYCEEKLFRVASSSKLNSSEKRKTVLRAARWLWRQNSTEGGTQTETYKVLLCSPSLLVGLQQESISFSAVNIFLFITAFLGNFLILVALNKEYSHHPPSNSCIVVWQQLICWLVLLGSLSLLPIGCPWFTNTGVFFDTQRTQSTYQAMHYWVSLFTFMAISVDRLPALLLGIR